MRAEALPQLLVAALADEVEVQLADRRQEAVGVLGRDRPVAVVDVVAVGERQLDAREPALEHAAGVDLLHLDGLAAVRHDGDGGGGGAPRAHDDRRRRPGARRGRHGAAGARARAGGLRRSRRGHIRSGARKRPAPFTLPAWLTTRRWRRGSARRSRRRARRRREEDVRRARVPDRRPHGRRGVAARAGCWSRVEPEEHEALLAEPGAAPFEMRGRRCAAGCGSTSTATRSPRGSARGADYARSLPPK